MIYILRQILAYCYFIIPFFRLPAIFDDRNGIIRVLKTGRKKYLSHYSLGAKTCAIIRGCQIGMQGPQLYAEPRQFCKLDVATSRIAFLDLNLHVLQVAPSNSKN